MEPKKTISKELIKILVDLQKELPVVKRTTKAYNYKYAPLEEVWDNIKDVINGKGFAIINEISEGGVRTNALHEHGELTSFIPFSNEDLKAQDRGAQITYARRYNLTAIFNVVIENEDNDAQKNTPATPITKPAIAPKPVVRKATLMEIAQNQIKKAGTVEVLSVISNKIAESEKFTDDEKEKLFGEIEQERNDILFSLSEK